MRLEAPWLTEPGTQAVFDALDGCGAWFVGGCVRDGLLERPVEDIDICTDARPADVIARAKTAGLRAIPTGIDHGTVTLIAAGRPFEITTLRRDIDTDGRHAQVAFSDRLEEDAARRDFTMNALYATRDGTVIDPNGTGIADLAARHLRFIGDPSERIAEDYLRILRFFRFFAWYAPVDGGIDAEGLAACAAGLDGLAQLSRERVGAETRKLLTAPDPACAVAAMDQSGVLSAILPGAEAKMLIWLTGIEGDIAPNAMRRLAAMGGEDAAERLRLSKAEATLLALYRSEMGKTSSAGELGYNYGFDAARDILSLRGLVDGRPASQEDLDAAAIGADAVFPVKAADLLLIYSGPALGKALKTLEARWIASGFTLTKDALLHAL
ncbi:CCA tRNA nucleotidyltransferase [Gymnodinialimonas sp. 2305UL16-5]|uniref:CCA tRNA nucleotidyltransferase n=1 Tax=Gymnodinialimonas mytili TaxID=3126503 RepID=UPI00309CF857